MARGFGERIYIRLPRRANNIIDIAAIFPNVSYYTLLIAKDKSYNTPMVDKAKSGIDPN